MAARVLSLYDPPPLLAGCSQAVIGGALVRNYDYHPDRIEGTVLASAILRPVLGMSDCLWGLLDGVNDAGLAVALAWGGRHARGPGFGITLVVRYLLETCETVEQAATTLARLPVHAPYNLTLADAQGGAATVYLGPDRAARVVLPAGRHQPPGAGRLARARARDALGRAPRRAVQATTAGAFLEPPLYATEFARGFGTLYTAVYRPGSRAVTYRWPQRELAPVAGAPLRPARGPSDSPRVQTATASSVIWSPRRISGSRC